jgi:hypothetical protein
MHKHFHFSWCVILGLFLGACNLQQEIDLDLPEYEPELLVESYLIPGNPYVLVLSRTRGFFDTLGLDFVPGAEVVIQHGNQVDTLYELDPSIVRLLLGGDSTDLINQVLGDNPGLYASVRIQGGLPQVVSIPEDYQSTFDLRIRTAEGERLTASTNLPAPIPIEYQQARFNDAGKALVLTAIQDPGGQVNYYRRVFAKRRRQIAEETADTTWSTVIEQDFVFEDRFTDGELIEFGTGFSYDRGDTLIADNYHITEDYYRFIDTRDEAIAASLSPFATPAILHTNISGGQGVFVGMTMVRDTLVIE